MERDSTEEWMLPEDRPEGAEVRALERSLAQLEARLDEAIALARGDAGVTAALEDGLAEVGRVALGAAERAGRAAELAAGAVERVERVAAGIEAGSAPPLAAPVSPAAAAAPIPAAPPDEDDLMRRFTEHADRVTQRLQALGRRPGMVQETAPDPQEQWP